MGIFKSSKIILLAYLILVIVFTVFFFVPTYTKTTLITTSSPFSRVTIDGGYRPIWILFEKDIIDKANVIHKYEMISQEQCYIFWLYQLLQQYLLNYLKKERSRRMNKWLSPYNCVKG